MPRIFGRFLRPFKKIKAQVITKLAIKNRYILLLAKTTPECFEIDKAVVSYLRKMSVLFKVN